jgi:hypothetical protein
MKKKFMILLCLVITACAVQKNVKNNNIPSRTNVLLEKQQIMHCFSGYKSAIQNDVIVKAVRIC